MRILGLFRKLGPKPDDGSLHICEARIGMGTRCEKPAVPHKKFCSFHNTLVGPWSRPDKHFKDTI